MLKHNVIQYFSFILHHLSRELFYGDIPGVVSGGNVRRGMKYPKGNVPDPSWADEQDKMLITSSNLLNEKKLSRRFTC